MDFDNPKLEWECCPYFNSGEVFEKYIKKKIINKIMI